ncbi:arylamine N-acetyltransferase [Streptomyces sp. AV19]|uniref:arylamine N-acetyltransferase family protein n=1 Tax=Streptomyces sp. AV19 TaxID=2793068 RepID=UPI0018FE05D8|nr:arylamine N-acetyltransferase [Streptomyces sp. AV19]MBH1937299.1 arylamine N-acetyltransferase [Streptomyces sp. AV19]MDG4536777.1 arylamine N-acetyltransferase [Streptomyces sp. AV19]
MQTDRSHGWDGELLDLDAYLERVGYDGERAPTLGALRGLHRAHVTSIPFENFAAVLGEPVSLELPDLQEKLVRGRRGGYCFEHALLFAAALERFGFEATGLSGRVTLGSGRLNPATHALLAVRAADDERLWLCDVGFGSGPLEPVELRDGAEAGFDGWRFRMERRAGALGVDEWWLHQHKENGWEDRHTFTLLPQYPKDWLMGSHYVATHPRSPFVRRLYAQTFSATRHHTLDATTWTTYLPDGSGTERKIEAAELGRVLSEEFGIVVDDASLARLRDGLDSA